MVNTREHNFKVGRRKFKGVVKARFFYTYMECLEGAGRTW